MTLEPTNKILPFKLREPVPQRWQCPCGSTVFTLWTDGHAHCAQCRAHHYRIAFTVDETPEDEP